MKGFFNSRQFRQGTMATAITVVVVAIVVVINFVSTALTDRFGLVLDLTPTKLLSISDETKDYIADLPSDVVIYVLNREESFISGGEYFIQANEVLKRYDSESNQISIEYKDIVADPTFVQNYPTLQLSPTSILVTSGDRVRDITPYDLYDITTDQNTGQGQITASKAEQTLTSAILAVTSDTAINVAVISGHNEGNIDAFRSLLQQNNYLVDQVSILTADIEPIYDVAIIAAPVRDYDEEELQRLDRFLRNDGQYGKSILYLASSEQTVLPNLDAFLSDWGIAVTEGMVVETNTALHIPNAPYIALVEYADNELEYSFDVQAEGLPVIASYARPVSLLFDAQSYINTYNLLQFSATAGVITADSESVEPSGPIPYLVMGRHLSYDGTTPLMSYVVASGSSAIIDSQFLNNASFANSEYLLSLLDELTGKEEGVMIQSKAIGSEQLNINAAQAYGIGVIFTVIFPLVILIFGITIWARRRHR
jgi:ABC-type uncharacterized transport system involved in gliding motility auxiliary subunit